MTARGRAARILFGAGCALALACAQGCWVAHRLDPCGKWLASSPGGEVLPMTFSPEGGGFRVRLPPTKAVEEAGGGEGKTYRWLVLNQGQYEISYVDSDRNLEDPAVNSAMLDRLKEVVLSKAGGRLEAERDLRLGSHPGRELLMRGGRGVFIQRFYVAGGRLYQVSASVPSGIDGCALDGVVKNLDSFELLEGEGASAGAK